MVNYLAIDTLAIYSPCQAYRADTDIQHQVHKARLRDRGKCLFSTHPRLPTCKTSSLFQGSRSTESEMCPIPFRTSIRLRFPCTYNNPKFSNSRFNVVTHVCKTLYRSSDHTTLHFDFTIFNTIITTSFTYYDDFRFYSQNYERCSNGQIRRARSSAIQDRFTGSCSAEWRGPGQE